METTPTTSSRAASRESRRRAVRRHRAIVAGIVAAVVLALGGAAAAFFLLGPRVAAAPRPATTARPSLAAFAERARSVSASATAVVAEAGRPATLTISAVGDMIFDRQVKTLISSAGGAAPLAAVASHLSAADVAVGNLESPLSSGGVKNATKDVTFRGDPRGIEGLTSAGFDLLSMANNHVLDYGPDALADTVATLDAHGIAHAGAGADRDVAWKPASLRAMAHRRLPGVLAHLRRGSSRRPPRPGSRRAATTWMPSLPRFARPRRSTTT